MTAAGVPQPELSSLSCVGVPRRRSTLRSLLDDLIDLLEVERLVLLAVAVVELVLELDPLQAERVEEGGEVLHDHQHDYRDDSPHRKGEPRCERGDGQREGL